jgi:hypothetical protein
MILAWFQKRIISCNDLGMGLEEDHVNGQKIIMERIVLKNNDGMFLEENQVKSLNNDLGMVLGEDHVVGKSNDLGMGLEEDHVNGQQIIMERMVRRITATCFSKRIMCRA